MVPSMDLLKALFSFCHERLNWLRQIPDILMPYVRVNCSLIQTVFILCISGTRLQRGPVCVSYI